MEAWRDGMARGWSEGTVVVVDGEGRQVVSDSYGALSFSPNGDWVVTLTWPANEPGTVVRRVSLSGGATTELGRSSVYLERVSLSPNGDYLLASYADHIVDETLCQGLIMDTGDGRHSLPANGAGFGPLFGPNKSTNQPRPRLG